MAEYVAKRDPNRCPTHPGELLRDVIPATGKSKGQIAELLGISRQHLYDILKERKPVSPAVAVRLGKLFGEDAPDGVGARTRRVRHDHGDGARWPVLGGGCRRNETEYCSENNAHNAPPFDFGRVYSLAIMHAKPSLRGA